MAQTKFHNLLCTYFNKSELRTLCFDLSINYENLPGSAFDDKARELIAFCHRHGQLELLVKRCCELRPIVSWPDIQELSNSLNKASKNLPSSSLEVPKPIFEQNIYGNYNAVSGPEGKSTINVTNIHQSSAEDSATVTKDSKGL